MDLDGHRLRFLISEALSLIPHDRWLLGHLHRRRLRVLIDSHGGSGTRSLPLGGASARCLSECRPLAVRQPPDWVAGPVSLLYVPVGLPGQPPAGLLALGSYADHRYTTAEIAYVAALAVACTAPLLALSGRGRLQPVELRAARLAAQGLSLAETSAALRISGDQARTLLGAVLRKLNLRSPRQLARCWVTQDGPAGSSG